MAGARSKNRRPRKGSRITWTTVQRSRWSDHHEGDRAFSTGCGPTSISKSLARLTTSVLPGLPEEGAAELWSQAIGVPSTMTCAHPFAVYDVALGPRWGLLGERAGGLGDVALCDGLHAEPLL